MDLEEIKPILQFMEENGIVEFEYESEGRRVKLRRKEDRTIPVVAAGALPVAPPAPSAPAEEDEDKLPDNVVDFTSPLVGTFYQAPRPDADPFVKVGDTVNAEKVLCIIEAMKVMNEIKAEMDGVIREIVARNGQTIEFGQSLFHIEKS